MSVGGIRDLIVEAKDPWDGKIPPNAREGFSDVSHIAGGLYISNHSRFVETFQTNPNNFEVIVSVCGYPRLQRAQQDILKAVERSTVENHFKERKVEWLQIGDAVPDDNEAWTDLIFNATFP